MPVNLNKNLTCSGKMFGLFKKKDKKQFGEIAINRGLVSEKDFREALETQKEWAEKHQIHKEIGAILAEKGILSQEDIETVLEEQKAQTSLTAWFCALFGLSR